MVSVTKSIMTLCTPTKKKVGKKFSNKLQKLIACIKTNFVYLIGKCKQAKVSDNMQLN